MGTGIEDNALLDGLSETQSDEIQVLKSIYGEQFVSREKYKFSFLLPTDTYDPLGIDVTLLPTYPDTSAPSIHIASIYVGPLTLRDEEKLTLERELIEMFEKGEVVLFQWFEHLRTYVNDRVAEHALQYHKEENEPELNCEDDSIREVEIIDTNKLKQTKGHEDIDVPEVFSSQPLTERKSTFVGHAARVSSIKEVQAVMEHLLSNRHIARATHNIMAYRIVKEGANGTEIIYQDHDDDGENAAGGRLSHLLSLLKARNVIVIVTRWFGGVKLGPDRFRIINQVARETLDHAYLLSDNKASS